MECIDHEQCGVLFLGWRLASNIVCNNKLPFIEVRNLSSCDLVAGAFLIQEAGGLVTDLDCSSSKLVGTRNMLYSNGIIHDEVLGIFREADKVSLALLGLQYRRKSQTGYVTIRLLRQPHSVQ
jgi:hypothetical protein